MQYANNFQTINHQTTHNPSYNYQRVASIPAYNSPSTYSISQQKYDQQTSYVESELEKSLKSIQNIKKQLPSFSAYSMVNTSVNMGKHSSLIQSKYEVSRINEELDQENSSDSVKQTNQNMKALNQSQQHLFNGGYRPLMSVNVNRSEMMNPTKESFQKISNRFSSFSEQNLQIEDERVDCVICYQTYLLANQKDHLLKHQNRLQNKAKLSKEERPNCQTSNLNTDQRLSQQPELPVHKSITFGSHLSMESSYSITFDGNKNRKPEAENFDSISQKSDPFLSSEHSYEEYLPKTLDAGVQVSIKASSVRSYQQSQPSITKSKQSLHSQILRNHVMNQSTQKPLIQIVNYEMSSKSSSSRQSGSFAAFSENKMVQNQQNQSIINFDSRILPDYESETYRKSAKSLQCTYGRTFLEADGYSVVNYQKGTSSKSRTDKLSQKIVDQMKEKSLKSNHSSKKPKSKLSENHLEETPCFKTIEPNEPPTMKEINASNQYQSSGIRKGGKVQKINKPSCSQQSVLSLSDLSIRPEETQRESDQKRQTSSIRSQNYRSEKNAQQMSSPILIEEEKCQSSRYEVSPFKKSSKPRVQEIDLQQKQIGLDVQSRKATISARTNEALKMHKDMGLGTKEQSESGRSGRRKRVRSIFAQSEKGQRK